MCSTKQLRERCSLWKEKFLTDFRLCFMFCRCTVFVLQHYRQIREYDWRQHVADFHIRRFSIWSCFLWFSSNLLHSCWCFWMFQQEIKFSATADVNSVLRKSGTSIYTSVVSHTRLCNQFTKKCTLWRSSNRRFWSVNLLQFTVKVDSCIFQTSRKRCWTNLALCGLR